MLSNKFIVIILVLIVIVFGFGIFPAFNTSFRTVSTTGLGVQIAAIVRFFPWFLMGVIFYAAYVVYRRGKQ